MRESSQTEVECNEEPLPPGEEQVEVERAWLVGRDSVRPAETASGENQADREEATRRMGENQPVDLHLSRLPGFLLKQSQQV